MSHERNSKQHTTKKLRSFKGKMLKMSQVTSIREQWSEGKTISEIARAVSVDRNTVYKYTQMTDFSKAVALYVPRGCMLDKHRDEIIAMLKEERKWFHKQRYTAKRIQRTEGLYEEMVVWYVHFPHFENLMPLLLSSFSIFL